MGTTIESSWENERLRDDIKRLEAELAQWKNHHATEVRRARILKERTDMPVERVRAYEKWKEDQRRVAELEAELQRVQELSLRECGVGFVDVRILRPNAAVTGLAPEKGETK